MSTTYKVGNPELVFGLVGPIGVDMDSVQDSLRAALTAVGYQSQTLHLTKEFGIAFVPAEERDQFETSRNEKIKVLNDFRKHTKEEDVMALFAISLINTKRAAINEAAGLPDEEVQLTPVPNTAFIVRQLKRKEEIRTLRTLYGTSFIQVSVTIPEEQQKLTLKAQFAQEDLSLSDKECESKAEELILKDQKEGDDPFGQRLSETFHTADVFIDGTSDETISKDITRFVNALFGQNSISPTIDEFGSNLAKTASLRSIDMSRQVGSAIMSKNGEIITIGCNEVPKAGGGNYWCSDPSPQRDMDRKVEANKLETSRIISNFLEVLKRNEALSKAPDLIMADAKFQTSLKDALISDITEFGRMTHAEMAALTDAARLGREVSGATIYVTTFPCHNCAKHLIAAGISRIVYIEPYPKSRALMLHNDALTTDPKQKRKVRLEHFHGISPRVFRNIFEKEEKRKDDNNRAKKWYFGAPKPLLGDPMSAHVAHEELFIRRFDRAITQFEANSPPNGQ